MNKLLRIPFTDRALVIADDPHGQAEHYPGGLGFNTTATAEVVRGGEVIDRRELGSGVITTAGINKWAAMLNAKQGPLYSATTTALGPYMLAAGTGTTAPAITDTGLQTAIGTTGVAYSSRSVNLLGFNVAGVAYGNGTYVAVGGTGGIATSTDAVNWTVRNSLVPTATHNCVIYANGLFYAGTGGGVIISSTDGSSWAPSGTLSGSVRGLAYNGSVYVAVPASGAPYSSTDGINWVSRYNSSNGNLGPDVSLVYLPAPVGHFVAWSRASGVTNNIHWSTDGVTWGTRWQSTSDNAIAPSKPITFGSNFAVVQNNPASTQVLIFARPAGNDYNPTFPGVINHQASNGTTIVWVGQGGAIYTSTTVSSSLSTYTARTSGTTASLVFVTYLNNQFIAFSNGNQVLTSPDGITWTTKRLRVASPSYAVGDTGWFSANSTYLLWGGSNNEFARSADLATWYKQPAWFKFTTSYSNPYAVSEFGIFGGNTSNNLAGATLFDRRTFTPINVTGGDSINWYWGVTGAAGG